MELRPGERAASEPAPQEGGRSAPELAVLLLELASVLKARAFFSPGDPKLATIFDRCLRAWQSDLARHGALALELSPAGFREVGGGGVLRHARLEELLAVLRSRAALRLHFEPGLDGDALAGFVHVVADPSLHGAAFRDRLAALVPIGISVEPEAPTTAEPPPQERQHGQEAHDDDTTAPQIGPASEGSGELAAEAGSDAMPIDETVDTGPLDMLLSELALCGSPATYLDVARRAVTEAERARDADASFRVLDAFAQHAEGKAEKVGAVALSFLTSQCQGGALGDLLERAARGSGAEQVRAAQILALVGEPAVAAVLDRMHHYPEPVRREHLVPLVLALGERAAPELLLRLDRPDPDVVRSASHILGLMQHPAAVPRLADLASGPDPTLREEAARALVRIGSEEAVAALARGLHGERDVMLSSIQHLGTTASARAVAPLGHALERALDAKDTELAKEIVRALGRVGRPEANVVFGSVMRRKAGLASRWLKDVKVAAASALATVPGDQAVALLAEALQSRDEPLRRAAQRALDRRAEAVARGSRVH